MMRSLAPDRERATIAVATAIVVLALPSAWRQVGTIAARRPRRAALLRSDAPTDHVSLPMPVEPPHRRGPAGDLLRAAGRRCRCSPPSTCRAGRQAGRRFLSRRFAGVRRRPRRAAASAGGGRAARLGHQRRLSRRLRRRPGRAGPLVHLRRLSRRRHEAGAAWRGGRRAVSRGGLRSRPSCWSSAPCRSGRSSAGAARRRPPCAA